MGTDAPDARDGESPPRQATVKPFYLDRYPVSNAKFLEFARATKYKT